MDDVARALHRPRDLVPRPDQVAKPGFVDLEVEALGVDVGVEGATEGDVDDHGAERRCLHAQVARV